jgi:plastocyanin
MAGALERVVRRAGAFFVAAALLAGVDARAEPAVTGTVVLERRPAAGAVVYLEGAAAAPRGAPAFIVMDQRNLAFVPGVLPVVRGTVVEFRNSDAVQHNVFSPSATAGKFDLGTYARGAVRQVTFEEPGEVLVLCNIHMEMQATILVLRDPYFATADADGRYAIDGVPAGTYTLKVWHRRWQSLTRSVDVAADGPTTVDVDG